MNFLATRALSLTLAATVAIAAMGVSQANAAVRYAARPAMGGIRMERGPRMERREFGRADVRRGDGRGFDFGGGRVGTALGAATLALGIFGAVAQAAQPRCGIANQPILRPNGTYFYRRVQVCQ